MRLRFSWHKILAIALLSGLFPLLHAEEAGNEVITLNVRPQADTSADDNDGLSRDTALATIQAAVDRAKSYLATSQSVDIRLYPGVYPGFQLELDEPPEDPETRLRLFPTIAGRVSFIGGERIRSVAVSERDRKIVNIGSNARWDFFILDERTLVLPKQQAPGYIHFERRGQGYRVLFDQIITKEDFSAYGVRIDPTDGKAGIHIRGVPVIIENLAFRAFPEETAVWIEDASVTIENSQFELNAGHGLKITGGAVASLSNVMIRYNGLKGLLGQDLNALTTTASRLEFNGWRIPADSTQTSANTLERINRLILSGQQVTENRSPGAGLTIRNSGGLEMNNAFVAANPRTGLILENLANGAILSNGQFVSNLGPALEVRQTAVVYGNNIFYGTQNSRGQPLVIIRGDDDAVQTWRDNILAQEHRQAPIIQVHPSPRIGFINNKNLYFAQNAEGAFSLRGGTPLDIDLKTWQEITASDLDSHFAAPRFLDPRRFNFGLSPDTPWFNRNQWPVRELAPSQE